MYPAPSITPDGPAARVRWADFDDLASESARRVTSAPAKPRQLGDLITLAQRLIPPLAAAEPTIRRVYDRNPDSIWAVERHSRLVGVFAMLLLNAPGYQALRRGTLDAANPATDLLTQRGEAAEAVYLWAIATPGFAVEAFRTVSRWLTKPAYASADIYTRPTTEAGNRFAVRIGFRPVPDHGLYRFQRHSNRENVVAVVA